MSGAKLFRNDGVQNIRDLIKIRITAILQLESSYNMDIRWKERFSVTSCVKLELGTRLLAYSLLSHNLKEHQVSSLEHKL